MIGFAELRFHLDRNHYGLQPTKSWTTVTQRWKAGLMMSDKPVWRQRRPETKSPGAMAGAAF